MTDAPTSPAASPAEASTPPAPAPRRPTPRAKAKSSGPAPGRIVAAAASISAGVGLVALMGAAAQDVVVQVSPTPVVVQPASVVVELPVTDESGTATGDPTEVVVRIVEPAIPAQQPVSQAPVVAQSEGS